MARARARRTLEFAAERREREAQERRNGKRSGPDYLLDDWPKVKARLRSAKRWALFLDFDGTLAGLRPRPAMVRLSRPVGRILGRLAHSPRIKIWLVSGRRKADLQRRARIAGVHYVGLHGWEREGNGALGGASQGMLLFAKNLLEDSLEKLPGVWIEDKGMAFALHYRAASLSAGRRARQELHKVMDAFRPELRVMKGKKVFEVLPREAEGKGAAVRALLGKLPAGTLPIYVGDDNTDESAFAVLPRGLTVRVGRDRQTRARYYLRSPQEVAHFLAGLEKETS